MSLAKLHLMSDLEALGVEALKRLLGQRQHEVYVAAANERASQLEQSFHATQARRARRRCLEKASAETQIFELERASADELAALQGFTLQRPKLPLAEPGDLVSLVSVPMQEIELSSDASLVHILAKGRVDKVTPKLVRIKLLRRIDANKLQPRPASQVNGQSSEAQRQPNGSEREASAQKVSEADGAGPSVADGIAAQHQDQHEDKDEEAEDEAEPRQEPTRVRFKIKFVYSEETHLNWADLELRRRVELALNRFRKLKCEPALHKSLVGAYDERADLVHQKARLLELGGRLPELRGQQRLAVEQSIRRRVSLVEGPAGSGKSLVAAYLAANMSRLKGAKVLVCSPIAHNVDRLAALIARVRGLQVVKLPADEPVGAPAAPQDRPESPGELAGSSQLSLRELSLGQSAANDDDNNDQDDDEDDDDAGAQSDQCYELEQLVERQIQRRAQKRQKRVVGRPMAASSLQRRAAEAKVMAAAHVVCCTNRQAALGNPLLEALQFQLLVLDDVQVCAELDCLLPIVATRGLKQVTLLSDMRRSIRLARVYSGPPVAARTSAASPSQIASASASSSPSPSARAGTNQRPRPRPTSESQRRGAAKSRPSSGAGHPAPPELPGGLFERLLAAGVPAVDFRLQFRSHPALANFTSHHFYLGRLKNDPHAAARLKSELATKLLADERRFRWIPSRKYLTCVLATSPSAEAERAQLAGDARRATWEARRVLLRQLIELKRRLRDEENIQDERIGVICNMETNPDKSRPKIKSGTVADFTGQERDFIILVALTVDRCAPSDLLDDTTADLGLASEIQCDFTRDDTALNCALTRARLGLFIIAPDADLDHNDHDVGDNHAGEQSTSGASERTRRAARSDQCRGWRDVLRYYEQSGLVVRLQPGT